MNNLDLLKAQCVAWQKVLRLQDWTVVVEQANPFELGKSERSAQINMEHGFRHARLSVLDHEHAPPDLIAVHDPEEALVHELLHIYFDPVETFEGAAQDRAVEQAINAIAHALVQMSRMPRVE